MHIPPKPFRARAMKMSTERAVGKQSHKQGTTAELWGGQGLAQCLAQCPAWSRLPIDAEQMEEKPSGVSA
jgi:hypothetical protein